MTPIVYLILVVICIFLSAFFSGSEIALMRLRKEEIEKDVENGRGASAYAIRDLLKSKAKLLVTILFGNNVVNILATSAAAALAIHFLGETYGVLVATIVMTIFIFILSEVLPKALAVRNPRQFSRLIGLPLYIFHRGLKPIHILYDRFIHPVVRLLMKKTKKEEESTSELLLLLARKSVVSDDEDSAIPIITSTAKAREMTVEHIMIPRAKIFSVSVKTPVKKVFQQALKEKYTRIPVYEGSIDKILGIVHFKDLTVSEKSGTEDLKKILKPVLRIPKKKPILDLLREMLREYIHFAVIKDEFGGTQGIVTQEDVLEEIVGEIRDEFDAKELNEIQKVDEQTYDALASVTVHDFNKVSGWTLEGELGTTLGGIVFNKLGRMPSMGDQVVIGEHVLGITKIMGTTIVRLRVFKPKVTKEHSKSE